MNNWALVCVHWHFKMSILPLLECDIVVCYFTVLSQHIYNIVCECVFDMLLGKHCLFLSLVRKPDFGLCESKGVDRLCSYCTADQHLCFRCSDSTISLLLIDKKQACSFLLHYRPIYVAPRQKPQKLVFSRAYIFPSLIEVGVY